MSFPSESLPASSADSSSAPETSAPPSDASTPQTPQTTTLPYRPGDSSSNSQSSFLFIDAQEDNPQNPGIRGIRKQKRAFALKNYHQRRKQASIDRLKPSSSDSSSRQRPLIGSTTASDQTNTGALNTDTTDAEHGASRRSPARWTKSQGDFLQALDSSQDPRQLEATARQLCYERAICTAEVAEPYPIPCRPYMPELIRNFCEGLGVSKIPADTMSIAYRVRTIWIQSALSDPCLFHATLFAGSLYSDLLRGQNQSTITIYHMNEAIRLINVRLSDPNMALDDRTIASVTSLSVLADLSGDRPAADAHRAGLQKMLKMKGNIDELSLSQIAAASVYMDLSYTVAFDLGPGLLLQTPYSPPIGLESRILDAASKNMVSYAFLSSVKDLIQDVYNLKRQLTREGPDSIPRQSDPDIMSLTYLAHPPVSGDPLYRCCYLAAVLFGRIIQARADSITLRLELDTLVNNLMASLAYIDDEMWLRYVPETLSWVCLTGAAAAKDSSLRTWFYFKQAPVTRLLAVDVE